MRLPRFRFTLRLLMIAVAIAAITFRGGRTYRLRQQYLEEFQTYKAFEEELREGAERVEYCGQSGWRPTAQDRREMINEKKAALKPMIDHLGAMRRKYEYAANHPWLAVEPDAPMPW